MRFLSHNSPTGWIVAILLLLSSRAWAQTNTFPSSGDVGIGTTTPSTTLDVAGDVTMGRPGGSTWDFQSPADSLRIVGITGGANLILVPNSGNIGIGTTSPPDLLSVYNSSADSFLRLMAAAAGPRNSGINFAVFDGNTVSKTAIIGKTTGWYQQDLYFVLNNQNSTSSYNLATDTRMMIQASTGNVGIGTVSPASRLSIFGGGNGSIDLGVNGRIQTGDANSNGGVWLNSANTAFIGTEGNTTTGIWTGGVGWAFSVLQNGYVGIGTANPIYPLTVNGTVRAKEVIVDTGWSDYVFAPGYRLMPLGRLGKYLESNRHLPGIPSAKEVKAQGINVGEMQAKLLLQVEELTLRVIAQEKRIDDQADQIRRIEEENKTLRERVSQ